MTKKRKYTILSLAATEAPEVNNEFDQVYSSKLESRQYNSFGTATIAPFQMMENGSIYFSATGSPTITQSVLIEKYNTFVTAHASCRSTLAHAVVTDVTNTSISITLRTISGTANFSDVTTASLIVDYTVIGSKP